MQQIRKSLTLLTIAFFLLSLVAVASMMGIGRTHDARWLDLHTDIVSELQDLRESYKDMLLASQRYLITGDKLQFSTFDTASNLVKEHLYALKAQDGGRFANSEKMRGITARLTLVLEQVAMDVQSRKARDVSFRDRMFTTRELREASRVSQDLLEVERLEEQEIRGYLARESKAQGNALPMILMLLSALCGVFGLATMAGARHDDGIASDATSGDPQKQALQAEIESLQAQLERLANIDDLTEALNTRGLEKALRAEENRAFRAGNQLIAMALDCDNFQKVNAAFGPRTSDVILKEICKRIKATLRPSDHVARVDGDEFVILLPDTQLAYGLKVAERIRASIADAPLKAAQDLVPVTASIGLTALPSRSLSTTEVLTFARSALKRAQQEGNRVALGRDSAGLTDDIDIGDDEHESQSIVAQLLDQSQFKVLYQPIIDLRTEEISGYEALSRGPDGAFESPGDFFRLCVENNILSTVDLQCLKLCLANTPPIGHNRRIHLNLFPSTLLEIPVDQLIALFPADRKDTTYCIEISEQQFVSEPSYIRDHVAALKQAGILVAIDDVGFGRSSLETLILLEPDLVKVDRTYVAGVASEPAKARLLRRLANVAKSLGAEIVAEGIENKNDLPVLMEMGINYGQGFLWGGLLPVLPPATMI
ncbi:MAG: bifunctional diguanylate cyclase/phosphodiesterase [Candidatus Obscuribacterales bacterium]|nr:bifunctional diguanylate cyclase/phosphodiesterase [Candidatus Obscuribacterales bacterium]